MSEKDISKITVCVTVKAPLEEAWDLWTVPFHILHWNHASADWVTSRAENDLRPGGRFLSRMEAREGSTGFDFKGTYTNVVRHKLIEYSLDDGRGVSVSFTPDGSETSIRESFETEKENSPELQRQGWQAILDNFRKYAESRENTLMLRFETEINTGTENVFNKVTGAESYKEWASVFNPSSDYHGSWDKGSKMQFFGFDEDGEVSGMVSKIRENIPGRFISIEHLGMLKGRNEITTGPGVAGWAGLLENYSFVPDGDNTLFTVEIDAPESFAGYFRETWPKALKVLKSVCER